MCQVVAYRRLKTIDNSKLSAEKVVAIAYGIIYERFQNKALTENIFGVLERWSLMGGGRLRKVVTYGRWSHVEVRLYSVLGSDHEKSLGVLS